MFRLVVHLRRCVSETELETDDEICVAQPDIAQVMLAAALAPADWYGGFGNGEVTMEDILCSAPSWRRPGARKQQMKWSEGPACFDDDGELEFASAWGSDKDDIPVRPVWRSVWVAQLFHSGSNALTQALTKAMEHFGLWSRQESGSGFEAAPGSDALWHDGGADM